MRSKMWLKGRNERQVSPAPSGVTCRQASTFEAMFECESIAPLGSPVVPEV